MQVGSLLWASPTLRPTPNCQPGLHPVLGAIAEDLVAVPASAVATPARGRRWRTGGRASQRFTIDSIGPPPKCARTHIAAAQHPGVDFRQDPIAAGTKEHEFTISQSFVPKRRMSRSSLAPTPRSAPPRVEYAREACRALVFIDQERNICWVSFPTPTIIQTPGSRRDGRHGTLVASPGDRRPVATLEDSRCAHED